MGLPGMKSIVSLGPPSSFLEMASFIVAPECNLSNGVPLMKNFDRWLQIT